MEHRTDGTDAFDTLYIGAKNPVLGRLCFPDNGDFVAAVNGEGLSSGLAVLVGKAGAHSLARKPHRKSSLSVTLSPSMFRG